jgi:hypothetical protein
MSSSSSDLYADKVLRRLDSITDEKKSFWTLCTGFFAYLRDQGLKLWDAVVNFGFFFTAAALVAAVGGLMYAGNVRIGTVDLGQLFLIIACCLLAFVPAQLLEYGFFFLVKTISLNVSILRDIDFLLSALETKITILLIGIGALVYIKLCTDFFSDEVAQTTLNVFLGALGVWALFDSLLQALLQRWNMVNHLERINLVIYKEAVLRNLAKPTIRYASLVFLFASVSLWGFAIHLKMICRTGSLSVTKI